MDNELQAALDRAEKAERMVDVIVHGAPFCPPWLAEINPLPEYSLTDGHCDSMTCQECWTRSLEAAAESRRLRRGR